MVEILKIHTDATRTNIRRKNTGKIVKPITSAIMPLFPPREHREKIHPRVCWDRVGDTVELRIRAVPTSRSP